MTLPLQPPPIRTHPWSRSLTFFLHITTLGDRWLMVASALLIVWSASWTLSTPGSQVVILKENQPVQTLSLQETKTVAIAGRLGSVRIQVANGQARLVEFDSPRLIGTRTGWISAAGQIAACVPCGIFIRIQGTTPQSPTDFDAMSR